MSTFNCPYCSRANNLVAIWCRFCQQVISGDLRKTCPTCNQSILKWSRHCRFCDTSFEVQISVQTPPNKTLAQLTPKPDDDDDPPPAGAMVLRRPKNPEGGASDQIDLPRDTSR